ncbi:MAG: HEAT repeat domain-containing protein [Gemmatimonadota bacterium]|nr:HEAT repeat domain-containing protein [Gemmatimonadota bacterium]
MSPTAFPEAVDPSVRCPQDVPRLLGDLVSEDGLVRRKARRCLVRLGEAAAPALMEALSDPRPLLRLEAAEALLYIASPMAAASLVEALDDREFGVRWLAAEALIALKCGGLVPLLEGIPRHADSLWFRQAAHHVLHDHYCEVLRDEVRPVLEALGARGAEETAPVAAHAVLKTLTARR